MRRTACALMLLVLCSTAWASDFDPWTQSARYELEYRVDVSAWTDAKPGTVRVWVPLPVESDDQHVLSHKIESPWPHRETQDSHGNRFLYCEPAGEAKAEREIVLRFVVERSPRTGVSKTAVRSATTLDPRKYLEAQRRIPLDGRIRALAEETCRGAESGSAKIRAFYDHVTRTMQYSKHGKGWGRGDALWACDSKYGNCTDFHSVFIGLTRSQGIPARFVMGFPIKPDAEEVELGGYHCWAEAYDRERGWLPIDASEAAKAKRPDAYFGKLPSDRIEFTVGRDLILEPRQQAEPLNYFIYPYAEVDGKPANRVPWKAKVRRASTKDVGNKEGGR